MNPLTSLRNFAIRVGVSALAIMLIAALLPGINVVNENLGTYLVIGVVVGLVNGLLRPILSFLTCPLVLLTLGLFTFVVNGLLLQLVAWIVGPDRLVIENFLWAILGGFLLSIVLFVLESFIGRLGIVYQAEIRAERSVESSRARLRKIREQQDIFDDDGTPIDLK